MTNVATPTTAIAIAALLAGCGENAEPERPPANPPEITQADQPAPVESEDGRGAEGTGAESGDEGGDGEGSPALSRGAREAIAAARAYIAALDGRDGGRACTLLAPGAIDLVELPRGRGGCAASLDASIGYRDPRGVPVWESSSVEAIRSVEAKGADARVVATVLTRFADRDEPSVEDDVIYLRRVGDDWLLAKPSLTLYRAVGYAAAPPEAIAPPKQPPGG